MISVKFELNGKEATLLLQNPPTSVEELIDMIKEEEPSLRAQQFNLIEIKTTQMELDTKTYLSLLENATVIQLQVQPMPLPKLHSEWLHGSRAAVVKVVDGNGWVGNTGFFVSPRLVLTAGQQPHPFQIQLENETQLTVGRKRDSLFIYNRYLGLTLATVDNYRSEHHLAAKELTDFQPTGKATTLYYTRDNPALTETTCVYCREEDLAMMYYHGCQDVGSSGAPVFSESRQGEVIGVHIGESNNPRYPSMFVTINSIAQWLQNQLQSCSSPRTRQSLVISMDLPGSKEEPNMTPRSMTESPQVKRIQAHEESVAESSREPSVRHIDYDECPATILADTKMLAVCFGDDLREISLSVEQPIPAGFAIISTQFGIFLSWDTSAYLWDTVYGFRLLEFSEVQRQYHCLALPTQGQVLVISGCNSKSCDVYSLTPGPKFGKRHEIQECVRIRAYATACKLNEQVYIVGGVGHQTIEAYTPDANKWHELYPRLPSNTTNSAVIPLSDSKLYIFGGSLQEALVFDVLTGATETKPDEDTAGITFSGHSCVQCLSEWLVFSTEGVLYTINLEL